VKHWDLELELQKLAQPAPYKALFWGAVKRYLRENCDYSLTTLHENNPKALGSVSVENIRKWWMEAYGDGLGAKDAQIQAKKFSSEHYKSHISQKGFRACCCSLGCIKISF
jgi:hypothetical protein